MQASPPSKGTAEMGNPLKQLLCVGTSDSNDNLVSADGHAEEPAPLLVQWRHRQRTPGSCSNCGLIYRMDGL